MTSTVGPGTLGIRGVRGIGAGVIGVAGWTRGLDEGVCGADACGAIGDMGAKDGAGVIGVTDVTTGARGDVGDHLGTGAHGVIGAATGAHGVIGVTTALVACMAASKLEGGGGTGGGRGGGFMGQPSKTWGISVTTVEGSACVNTTPDGAVNVYSVTFTLTCQPRSTACCARM